MNLKISVITPTLNCEKFISRAIESVVEQNYPDFEHVVVDGVSTDATIERIKSYSHVNLSAKKDSGQSEAMNRGFNLATGDIIVYLNGDDYFLPGAFNKIIFCFKKNDVKLVVGNLKNVKANGDYIIQSPSIELSQMIRYWEHSAFPHNPVQYFYRREVQEHISFNENNHFTMDYEFLLKARNKYPFTKLEEVLGVYNSLPGTKTVESQKDPESYWLSGDLDYVDNYLLSMPQKYIVEYKNDQYKFIIDILLKKYKKNNGLMNFISKVKNRR